MSKNITTIYLVRHGESESNRNGTIAGHQDPDLTEEGKEQVKRARHKLRSVHFDEVYSSDLRRAVQTAEILYGKPVATTNKMHVLRERYFGSMEGKSQAMYDEHNNKRQSLPHDEAWRHKHVPDMESDHELTERFVPALEKIAKANPGKTILVATHGGAIRTAIMRLTGYGYEELPAGSFVNAGYTELLYEPGNGFRVIQINGVKL